MRRKDQPHCKAKRNHFMLIKWENIMNYAHSYVCGGRVKHSLICPGKINWLLELSYIRVQ